MGDSVRFIKKGNGVDVEIGSQGVVLRGDPVLNEYVRVKFDTNPHTWICGSETLEHI